VINVIDIIGIFIFLILFLVIIKRYWFYSLYSFLRFLFFSVLALIAGLGTATLNPFDIFLSKLQIALLVTGIVFAILWKYVSFKKVFFWLDTHLFKIDRFVYFHKLNKIINIPPSAVASLFFTFFIFSIFLSLAPSNKVISNQVDHSKLFTPLSYKIFFSPSQIGKFNPFEGTVFRLSPALTAQGRGILETIRRPYVIDTATKINEERQKAGLPPISEVPIEPAITPQEDSPQNPNGGGQTLPMQPKPSPIVIQIPSLPTSSNPTPIPTPTSYQAPTTAPSSTNPTQPTSTQSIPTSTPLPLPSATPTPIPTQAPKDTKSIEQRIFELTNERRAENGVRALVWSEDIAVVARAHSQDMVDRNYFDHNTPEGITPFQRLTIGGVSYSTAGENIATSATAELIMNAWMNSPGHKANILNSSFGKLGVGVATSSKYGLMATQNFTN